MLPERVKVAAAILLRGLPKPKAPAHVEGVRLWAADVESLTLADDSMKAAQQRSAAMSLLDEDVIGYVLMTVRREFTGPGAAVRVLAEVDRQLIPAVNETMRRFVVAAKDRV